MTELGSGKAIDLICTEQAFPEFPDLLFGKATDGTMYFDATSYLQKKSDKNIDGFVQEYGPQIISVLAFNQLDTDDAFITNQKGDILIVPELVYIFLCYAEENFLGYINDRIHEMFVNGFCVSDAYLARTSSDRLSYETLKTMADEKHPVW